MPKETVVEEAKDSRPAIEIKSDEIKSETDHSQYMPKEMVVEEPKKGLNEAVVTMLMGYDNERLKEIVDKPGYYNPEVVAKAGQLLCRRLAWEQIKDLSDKELLNMSKGPEGMYDENIVEASSMELYQRGSKLLMEEFMLMSPDTVADIANGRTRSPEGVQLAARQFLSKNFNL